MPGPSTEEEEETGALAEVVAAGATAVPGEQAEPAQAPVEAATVARAATEALDWPCNPAAN